MLADARAAVNVVVVSRGLGHATEVVATVTGQCCASGLCAYRRPLAASIYVRVFFHPSVLACFGQPGMNAGPALFFATVVSPSTLTRAKVPPARSSSGHPR